MLGVRPDSDPFLRCNYIKEYNVCRLGQGKAAVEKPETEQSNKRKNEAEQSNKRKNTKASFKRGKRAKKVAGAESSEASEVESPHGEQELLEVFFSSQRDFWASQGLSCWVADEPCSGWAMRTALSDQCKWQSFQQF